MKTLVLLCLVVLLPVTLASCVDKHPSCSYWAFNGECTRNASYMNGNCCVSCNHVFNLKSKQTCTNTNSQCPNWAHRGECCKNPAYMLDTCCAACRAKGYSLP